MRFCLDLGHQSWATGAAPAAQIERTIAQVRAADDAGFDSVWLTEDPDGWDAFAVLAMLARETIQIRLGTGVTNPFLRHPNLIAASLATLDRISGGRAFLGLGRGQPEWYQRALGVRMVDPLAAVEETVDLLRQWNRAPFSASSDGPIHVDRWSRSIHPLGQPPIYLAATGPKMQELAGRVADGVRFNELASREFLQESIDRVRTAARGAGRDPGAIRFYFNPGVRITTEPNPSLDDLKIRIAMIHSLPGMDRQLLGSSFDASPVMARVRAAMRSDEILERGGNFNDMRREGDLEAAKRAIPDELVRTVAIVGSVDQVRARLSDVAALGVTDVFYNIGRSPGGIADLQAVMASLRRA